VLGRGHLTSCPQKSNPRSTGVCIGRIGLNGATELGYGRRLSHSVSDSRSAHWSPDHDIVTNRPRKSAVSQDCLDLLTNSPLTRSIDPGLTQPTDEHWSSASSHSFSFRFLHAAIVGRSALSRSKQLPCFSEVHATILAHDPAKDNSKVNFIVKHSPLRFADEHPALAGNDR